MFDLKMCFLDFMRLTGATTAGGHHPGPKQRKSLNELADHFGGIDLDQTSEEALQSSGFDYAKNSNKTPRSQSNKNNGFSMLGNAALNAHYMQKYNDVNIIYFNENLSMTSKCNTIKFQRGPVGTFKASPLNQSFSNRRKSIRDWDVLDADAAPLASFERVASASAAITAAAAAALSASSGTESTTDDEEDANERNGSEPKAVSENTLLNSLMQRINELY